MWEFINKIAEKSPEIAIALLVTAGLGYFLFWIIKWMQTNTVRLQNTISRQHKEALDVTNKVTDVVTELKVIIQTINK